MPLAAPIPVATDSVAPALLPAHGTVNGKAAITPGQNFSEIFLNKTGPFEIPAPKTIQGTEKSVIENDQPTIAAPADKEEPGQTESLPSGPVGNIPHVSSQPLQTQPQTSVRTDIDAGVTLAEASVSSGSSVLTTEWRATASDDSKQTQSLQSAPATISTQKTPQQKNTKQAAEQVSKQDHPGQQSNIPENNRPDAVTAAPPTPLPLPVSAAPASPTVPSPGESRPVLSHANPSMSASLLPSIEDASVSPENNATAPAAHGVESASPTRSTAADTTNTKSTYRETSAAAPDGKISYEESSQPENSTRPTTPGSLVHAAQTSTEPATPIASAVSASAAPPAGVHSAVSAVSLSVQPTSFANSSIAPNANAAASATTPYDKIDQSATPVIIHSGAQHVDVGVRDPDLGWLEIKTQNIAGHVDATLVTASGQTHAAIAPQLPAMADYLSQRDVRIGTLTVHHQMSETNSGTNSGANPGSTTGNGSGGGAESNKSGAQNSYPSDSQSGEMPTHHGSLPAEQHLSLAEAAEASWLRPVSYISVRA